MKESTFIKKTVDGNISVVVTTNDPSLILESDVINVTDFGNIEELKKSPNHFKINKNKIIELSSTEKAKKDKEKEKEIPINPIFEAIQKINDRLDLIEKTLKLPKL